MSVRTRLCSHAIAGLLLRAMRRTSDSGAQRQFFLQKLALRVLDQNDPANASSRAANLQTNAEMMADAIVELQALEDRLSKKKIQIYTNTETGAIVQHNGPFFLNPNRL